MTPERYTPTQTARQAGISPNTVRMWAREYKEHLSEYANPPAGVDRTFTSGDVAVMQAIAQLRANNLSVADVKERLRNTPPTALHDVTVASTAATNAPGNVADAPHVQTAIAPAADVLQTFLGQRDQLASIDRRLERVEHQRNLVLVALAGVAVGALVVGIIAVLVR